MIRIAALIQCACVYVCLCACRYLSVIVCMCFSIEGSEKRQGNGNGGTVERTYYSGAATVQSVSCAVPLLGVLSALLSL